MTTGSESAAAALLGLTQPTVHSALQLLEQSLAVSEPSRDPQLFLEACRAAVSTS